MLRNLPTAALHHCTWGGLVTAARRARGKKKRGRGFVSQTVVPLLKGKSPTGSGRLRLTGASPLPACPIYLWGSERKMPG